MHTHDTLYRFTIDGTEYNTTDATLTPEQLRLMAQLPATRLILQVTPNGHVQEIASGELVHLTGPHTETFISRAPAPAQDQQHYRFEVDGELYETVSVTSPARTSKPSRVSSPLLCCTGNATDTPNPSATSSPSTSVPQAPSSSPPRPAPASLTSPSPPSTPPRPAAKPSRRNSPTPSKPSSPTRIPGSARRPATATPSSPVPPPARTCVPFSTIRCRRCSTAGSSPPLLT